MKQNTQDTIIIGTGISLTSILIFFIITNLLNNFDKSFLNGEISEYNYDCINNSLIEGTISKESVKEAMKDDVITGREYREIMDTGFGKPKLKRNLEEK